MRVSDEKLFWYLQVSEHFEGDLTACLTQLRKHYPKSLVYIVSDGPNPKVSRAELNRLDVSFYEDEKVFTSKEGGKAVERMLSYFISTSAQICLKVDADTLILRRFAWLPPSDVECLFGNLQRANGKGERLNSLQGGCLILPRAAAKIILDSQLLRSKELCGKGAKWAVTPLLKARLRSGLSSFDWCLGWVCRELGLALAEHPEVYSRWWCRPWSKLVYGKRAVFHPRPRWSTYFFLDGFRKYGQNYFSASRKVLRELRSH